MSRDALQGSHTPPSLRHPLTDAGEARYMDARRSSADWERRLPRPMTTREHLQQEEGEGKGREEGDGGED